MGRNRIWSAISMSEGILERFGALAWSRAGRRGDGGNLRLRYENIHRGIKYHTASNTMFRTANMTLGCVNRRTPISSASLMLRSMNLGVMATRSVHSARLGV